MKVVLVTHDGAFGRWLAAPLWKAGAMDAVLVEAARPRLRFYWRKLARAGIRDFAFQAWLARWYEREGARAPGGAGGGAAASYITAATLARMPNGFLNLHTGYLPLYRGVKSELWALARGDTARLGRTLHYMTPELDAGDIVLRRCVEWEGESAGALRAKLLRDAALRAAPQGRGEYFSTPRWSDWRRYRQSVALMRAGVSRERAARRIA